MKIKSGSVLKGLLTGAVASAYVIGIPAAINAFKDSSSPSQFQLNASTSAQDIKSSQMLNAMLDKKNETINTHTLKKSLKMNLELCRGGTFDFSKTTLFKQSKSVSYEELISFVDNGHVNDLKELTKEFTKIVFVKKFSTKFSDLLTVKSLILENQTSITTIIKKIKDTLIQEGIEDLFSDFSFFTGDAKYDEKSIDKYLPKNEFFSFLTFADIAGNEFSVEQTTDAINNISTENDLNEFLTNGPQEPSFHMNLVDNFIIKYGTLTEGELQPKYSKVQNVDHNVDVEYQDFDEVFNNFNSLYDFSYFRSTYAWRNVISPMLQIKLGIEGNWRYQDDNIDKVIKDNQENSVQYSYCMEFEDIMNYQTSDSDFLAPSIPLATDRYFENKLKTTQSQKHGVTMFSPPDALQEAYTRHWYPSTPGAYQYMWQYMKNYITWGRGLTVPGPSVVNTAHKNGVRVFATLFNSEPSSMLVRLMSMNEDSKKVYINQLIKILKDRGVDGLFWNSEMASWSTSGMTFAGWKSYSEFLHIADTEFKNNGLMFYQYSNHDVEIPLEGKDKIADIIKMSGDDKVLEKTNNNWRALNSTPGKMTFSMNHFTYDFNFYDNEFGLGADHQIFNGFVDKIDMQTGIIGRLKFLKDHPEYTLNVMGWEDSPNTVDWINREWQVLQQIKNDPSLSAQFTTETFDEFYADYTLYGDRHHVAYSDDLEWSSSEFVSRGQFQQKQSGIKTDFHLSRFTEEDIENEGTNPSSRFQVSYWDKNGQDPRATTGALSDYFEERSVINDKEFSTSFETGYAHQFTKGGKEVFGNWSNMGAQDIPPTYRYIIDKYDSNGKLIDDSVNNYVKRDVTAKLLETKDAYYGGDVLTYNGILKANESIVNKLYVSNITTDKQFSIIVKDNSSQADIQLAVWKNKSTTPTTLKAINEEKLVGGYKKLTFNVDVNANEVITSFGIKIQNGAATDLDLSNVLVDGLAFKDKSQQNAKVDHLLTNFRASTNNAKASGVNVKFTDSAFDENTRYFIYDENDKLIDFGSSPYLHVETAGVYKIVVENNLGTKLNESKVSLNKAEGWING